MSALLIAPQSTELASYLVNRFYPEGKMYVVSSVPMMSGSVCSHENWVRFPLYNAMGIDTDEVSEATNSAINKIVKQEHEAGTKINKVFLFPNQAFNNNYLTLTYDSFLEATSSNFVVPISIISALFEYGICSPNVEIIIFSHRRPGFEAALCTNALLAALKRFQQEDVTHYSSIAKVSAFSVVDDLDFNTLDHFCEQVLAKEI